MCNYFKHGIVTHSKTRIAVNARQQTEANWVCLYCTCDVLVFAYRAKTLSVGTLYGDLCAAKAFTIAEKNSLTFQMSRLVKFEFRNVYVLCMHRVRNVYVLCMQRVRFLSTQCYAACSAKRVLRDTRHHQMP